MSAAAIVLPGFSEWGDQFLSPAWGDNVEARQSIAKIAACAASDLMLKATELRHERVKILKVPIGQLASVKPESSADAMQEIDTMVVTHGIVLATAQALLHVPPERREEWLNFIRDTAINAFAIATTVLEEPAEEG